VLAPGGTLVLSLTHPFGNWMRQGSYFEQRLIRESWRDSWQVSYWMMPLETICDEIHQAGFAIERLPEPRPQPAAEHADPILATGP
jgi:hypothetical protein